MRPAPASASGSRLLFPSFPGWRRLRVVDLQSGRRPHLALSWAGGSFCLSERRRSQSRRGDCGRTDARALGHLPSLGHHRTWAREASGPRPAPEPVGKGRLRDCGAAWRERGRTGSLQPGCVSERVCVLPVLMVPISLRSGLAADRGRWRGSRMACPRGDRCARWDVHFSDYARGIVCRGTVAGGY